MGKLEVFCETDLFHKIDWDDEASLHNWFESLDLTCVSKQRIGFIGSSLFIGWALGATFLPRLSDLYGRRRVFIGSMILQVVTFIGLYLSKNIDVTTFIMFVFGVASVGRTSLSFLYMMELLPANR
jgi:MFS family permease